MLDTLLALSFVTVIAPFEESLRDELRGSSLNPRPIRSSRSLRP